MNENRPDTNAETRKAILPEPRATIWAPSDGASGIPMDNHPAAGAEIAVHEAGAVVDKAGKQLDTAAQEVGQVADMVSDTASKGVNKLLGVDKPPVKIGS